MIELVSQHRVTRLLLLDVGDGLVGLRVRIRTVRVRVRLVLIGIAATVMRIRFLVLLIHYRLIGWRLRRIFRLASCLVPCRLLLEDHLLNLDPLPLEVRVEIFFEVHRHGSVSFRALHVFRLGVREIGCGCAYSRAALSAIHLLLLA